MQWFYFGAFTGVFVMFIRSSLPNKVEVFIGRKVGNHLQLHTWKHVSNKKVDVNNKRGEKDGTYILDTSLSDMSLKRFAFENPIMIFDEDSSSATIGIKGGQIIKNTQGQAKDFSDESMNLLPEDKREAIKELIKKGKIKLVKGKMPIHYDINPIWKGSAMKMKKYFKDKMVDSTWKAIILQTFGSNYIQLLIGIALGAAIAIAIYPQFAPIHYFPVDVTTTVTSTSSTTTASTTTIIQK